MAHKLSLPIFMEGGIDANTPLNDALEFLSQRHEVPKLAQLHKLSLYISRNIRLGLLKVSERPWCGPLATPTTGTSWTPISSITSQTADSCPLPPMPVPARAKGTGPWA